MYNSTLYLFAYMNCPWFCMEKQLVMYENVIFFAEMKMESLLAKHKFVLDDPYFV